ncbi:arginine-hydroxylase NDUFAF5, mitochondrial [Phlebotomus argentipes]|uniref:arginine-hydroxylase NDUFAF5, mitochondrial n=1 Tax=Phlebotomus argentipes TaxID=94469 RepID=UPI0028936D2F|nr:arginine-hydroxylase NDUFAF5, mitochondrial [Phlebotomus argentipes]
MIFTLKNHISRIFTVKKCSSALLSALQCAPQACHCPPTRNFSFDPVNIFDREAKKLQRERAALREDVDLYDYIKDEVGFRLADRVFDVKKQFKVGVDLGTNRGFVSRHILADTVEHLIMCEMSPTMLSQATSTPGVRVTKTEVDEEVFSESIEDDSVDLVISNLSLHWINDLPGCFVRIMKCLRPDGVFMASLFGGETLYELRSALQLAESERKGGISPHISPFAHIRDIGGLLNRAGFTMLTIDTDEIVVGFPSMFALLWDLKGMAENNAAFNRPLHLPRDTLIAASAIYEDMYKKADGGIPATFQVIYLVAWKPSPDQPRALPRGSGQVSLKDLDKVVEGKIKKEEK